MTLEDWLKNGWVRPHKTSDKEIASLLAVIDRDLAASASADVDPDWRFAIAYNAALQAAALALKASGYEVPKGGGAHHRTIESLRLTIAADTTVIETLQSYRAKRGGGVYETTGIASNAEIEELRSLASNLRARVYSWLREQHPDLFSGSRARPNKKR